MGWFGSIFDARESKTETLSEEKPDGTREYPSGTYGQSDYTVRERSDGTSDVYCKSDSPSGHSHDHIDANGNLIESYHDYVLHTLKQLTYDELQEVEAKSTNEYVKRSARMLLMNKKEQSITLKLIY